MSRRQGRAQDRNLKHVVMSAICGLPQGLFLLLQKIIVLLIPEVLLHPERTFCSSTHSLFSALQLSFTVQLSLTLSHQIVGLSLSLHKVL
jgi:hypothetical protein